MPSLQSGDLFERTHLEWIRSNLPCYEAVWAAFIGNDGENNALNLDGLDKDREARRGRFSQAHYSLAVTAYRLFVFRRLDLESLFPSKPTLDQYLAGHEHLFLFLAYVGHIRDMFKQMESALNVSDNSLSKDFQGFYDQRSHVIHGPQLPTMVDELSWLIPKIAKRNELVDEWHRNAIWKEAKADSVYVVDFIRDTYDELFRLIAEAHPKVFNAADAFFAGQRVKEFLCRIELAPNSTQEVFMTDGSSDMTIVAGSSSFKVPRHPFGKRGL